MAITWSFQRKVILGASKNPDISRSFIFTDGQRVRKWPGIIKDTWSANQTLLGQIKLAGGHASHHSVLSRSTFTTFQKRLHDDCFPIPKVWRLAYSPRNRSQLAPSFALQRRAPSMVRHACCISTCLLYSYMLSLQQLKAKMRKDRSWFLSSFSFAYYLVLRSLLLANNAN